MHLYKCLGLHKSQEVQGVTSCCAWYARAIMSVCMSQWQCIMLHELCVLCGILYHLARAASCLCHALACLCVQLLTWLLF